MNYVRTLGEVTKLWRNCGSFVRFCPCEPVGDC